MPPFELANLGTIEIPALHGGENLICVPVAHLQEATDGIWFFINSSSQELLLQVIKKGYTLFV